jgi:hypothetical protein
MEKLAKELIFKKDWIFDPPPELFKQFEFRDLARLAIVELRAEHAMMKVREEAIEQALEIYQGYAGR